MDGEVSCCAAGSIEASGDVVRDNPLGFHAYSLYSPYSPFLSLSPTEAPSELYCFSHVHKSTPPSPVHGTQWSSGYSGSLSLHEYRKNLSQQDNTAIPDTSKGRTLKRKAGVLNLNQTRAWTDFSLSSSPISPISSAPSSPPPLSFSQSLVSVISHNSDKDIANIFPTFSPSSFSNSRDLSLASNRSATRRNQNTETQISFRDRLERTLLAQEIPCFSHRKSVSDSIVLDLKKADLTILHEGTAFEILNPRDSFRLSRIVSTPETKRESFGSGEDKTTSGLIEDARSTMSPDRTPSRRPGDMTSENSQRRATPMRSLFDDLPTAYSQITGDHNLMMATRSSSTDFRSSLMNPLADRDRVPGSGTSGHHSANDQCDQQIEKTGSVSNANEQRSILRQLSNGSSASAKSVVGGFARPLLRRPKRARAAKDRLSNFLFPRSKLDHEGSNRNRLNRSTSDNSLFSGSQEQIDQQDMGEPIHMGAFSESTSSLNLCQPNYHSARGRIDKSSTINDIVHQRPRRGSISKFRERPVTSWPDPFRHTRRTSSPAPFHESRESSCQHGVPHDENSQETDIGQGAHLSLVGDEPAAPLPSICGRLESQDNVKQMENDNPDVAIPAEQLSEHEKTTERVISNANEEQLSEQLAAVELDTWPSHPFTAAPHGSGTFIPYTSSTGILGGYMPRQPKGASGYNRGPNSTKVSALANIKRHFSRRTIHRVSTPTEVSQL
ncbi:hypothetical protein DTO164E3_2614 [Paecilomyces variotii]|nr:hypothetical protein DTO164E3_2614 [Paecilomyces variotii]KAJ9208668.1 hypothetical protein DTO032I3_645 [Paecilomyces variotii]KAJ9282511.1 hypothetical protein DTO021D3_659 [Paecilomyces variotii]KAJ9287234.1 hypothetical protein DTO021C3_5152 [Paecilomyces variotii]KAJ9313255.1 hypothetical protein DTO271D3_6503 [Paecilomyces variotii]